MPSNYDTVAGHSAERLAALSDGIFGVGMTLLMLDLRVPAAEVVHGEHQLFSALYALLPELTMYLMSFITLGIFWVGQQTQLNHIEKTDRHLTWIHIGFLFAVTLTPFLTKLLAEFITYRLALVAYWLNILVMGAFLYASWGYSHRKGLIKEGTPPGVPAAVCRRIVIAQSLYAVGALLCLISNRASIAAIVAVQLYYALAPGYRGGKAAP